MSFPLSRHGFLEIKMHRRQWEIINILKFCSLLRNCNTPVVTNESSFVPLIIFWHFPFRILKREMKTKALNWNQFMYHLIYPVRTIKFTKSCTSYILSSQTGSRLSNKSSETKTLWHILFLLVHYPNISYLYFFVCKDFFSI